MQMVTTFNKNLSKENILNAIFIKIMREKEREISKDIEIPYSRVSFVYYIFKIIKINNYYF